MRKSDPQLVSKFWVGTKKQKYKIWMKDVDIKNVLTPEFLIQKVEYIHLNPLQEKWVDLLKIDKPEDYKYSSARFYLSGIEDHYLQLRNLRELL